MKADFVSLCVYGCGLLVTLLLCMWAQRADTSKRSKRIFFACLIALPLSIVAGLRFEVGTDYVNYVRIFGEIEHYSIVTYVTVFKLEPLFVIMVKAMQLLKFSNYAIFGVFEFIILFFPALMLIENKKKMNVTFGMFVFYLLLYHFSLNMVRQIMATSIILYVLPKLLRRKYLSYIIGVMIAYLIHSSSIICILFIVIPMLDGSKKLKRQPSLSYMSVGQLVYLVGILASPAIIYVFYRTLITLPFLKNYAHYAKDNVDIGVGFIFFSAVLFVPMLLFCGRVIKGDDELRVGAELSLMYIPLAFVEYIFNYGERLSFYSDMIFVLFIPMLCFADKKNKRFLMFYYSAYFIFNFFTMFVLGNAGETFPYVSIFSAM